MRVTAGVVVRNEATFLRESVCSIAKFVDEVIIVENGSVDGSSLICDELANNLANVLGIHLPASATLATARNVIDDMASGDWIIWWDADFIAYSTNDGENRAFSRMIDFIRTKGSQINQILYGGPNAGPTFETVLSTKVYHGRDGDTQITRKGLMRFRVDKFIDTRYYTAECKPAYLFHDSDQFYVHMDKIKPLQRLALRAYLYEYEKSKHNYNSSRPQTLLDFISRQNSSFTIGNLIAVIRNNLSLNAVPFDFTKYGPHPAILEDKISSPYYELTSDKKDLHSSEHLLETTNFTYLRSYLIDIPRLQITISQLLLKVIILHLCAG